MPDFAVYLLIAAAAYLLGSIPTGYLVARAKGVDIRAVGSGNMGATNVFRTVGKPAGIFVLLMDVLKGYAACTWLCDGLLELTGASNTDTELYRILAGITAVLGHNFTCWLRFKGGKGIATSCGVFFALVPLAAGIALASWFIILALSRYASVASIIASVVMLATVWMTTNSHTLRIVTTVLCLLAIYKHRTNIKRLLNGTEQRFDHKSSSSEGTK
jgi:acyl phosphate:glycerol-3-phosphate acyltransferase